MGELLGKWRLLAKRETYSHPLSFHCQPENHPETDKFRLNLSQNRCRSCCGEFMDQARQDEEAGRHP